MQIIRYVRIIKYWLNIVTCKKTLYVGALYYDALNGIDNHSGDSWIKSVRSLLCNHGFGDVWYNQGVGDPDLFLKLFRGRCFDIFKQNWQEQLKESPRARFYRAIKTSHCFSPYLKNINVESHRIASTRLLVSSHKLHVETERWEHPVTSPDERHCRVCVNKIEDGFHFLVECDLYRAIRRRLIPKYFWARPAMYKVVELVTTEKSSLLKRLSKYVYLATKIQQNVERPWIEVMLLIWFHFQARVPKLCIFLLRNVLSSPGGRFWNRCPGTQPCLYAHKLMDDVHWSLGTSGLNLPMADLLMSVPTTYPWATRSGIPSATAGTYPVLPADNAMKTLRVTCHLRKLHGESFHVSRCQLITMIVYYLCSFRLYGPVA